MLEFFEQFRCGKILENDAGIIGQINSVF